MAESVGQIGLDLVVNQNQFNKQMRSIESLAKRTGAALASAFVIKKGFDFGRQAIKLGSDLEEVQNVVDVTFPAMSKQVNDFAQNAATSFGLSETMAKKFTGTFGAMAKSFGFTEKEAYEMSTALTGLAGDVASFYNISQDEAYTKLKSVFTGETETLKELGVVMTQSALDQFAMANGFGRTTAAMSEQEKVALRYRFVMQQLALANGDFARTSDSWANQVRVLKLQFESFMAGIGGGLINIFTPVIKVINILMSKLVALANSFKSFTAMLMGKKVKSTPVQSIASSAPVASSGLSNIGSSAGKAGKAVEGIGKSAKKSAKAMKSLMGFDKVNKLSEPQSSSSPSGGSGGGGGAVGGGGITDGGMITETMDTTAPSKLGAEYMKLASAVDNLRNAFSMFVGIIRDAFAWVWENILKPFGKWTITEVAPRVINILAGAFKILNAVLLAFKPIWMFMWTYFIKPIATFTGKVFIVALEGISKALNGIGDWMLKHQGVVTAMEAAVLAFFAAWKVSQLINFISASGGVVGVMQKMSTAIKAVTIAKIKDKVESAQLMAMYIKDAAVTVKNTAAKGLNAVAHSKLGVAVSGLITRIKALTVAQKLGTVASLGVVGAIGGMAIYMAKTGTSAEEMASKIESFSTKLADGITAFADKLPTMLPAIVSGIETLIESLVGVIPTLVPSIINAGIVLFMGLVDSIDKIIAPLTLALPKIVTGVVKAIPIIVPALLNAGVKIFMALVKAIPKIIPPLVATVPSIIKAFIKALASAGVQLVKSFGDLFLKAVGKIKEVFSPITSWFSTKYQSVKNVFSSVGSWFGSKFSSAYNSVKNAFGSIGTWFSGKYKSVKNVFSSIGSWFSSKFSSAYNSAIKPFKAISSFFSGIYSKVKSIFKRFGVSIGNAIGGSFRSAMNAVLRTVENAVNKAIGLINGAIGLINKLPGVSIGKVGRVSLPRLAQGGYVKANTPQLAMIGDNRHQGEVVAPENKLREIAKQAVAEGSGTGGITKQELTAILDQSIGRIVTALDALGFYVDSEELARAVRRGEGKLSRRFSPIG